MCLLRVKKTCEMRGGLVLKGCRIFDKCRKYREVAMAYCVVSFFFFFFSGILVYGETNVSCQ